MSSMAWYAALPETGSMLSAADELVENQRAEQGVYWTMWNSRLSDNLNASGIYSEKQGDDDDDGAQCFDASAEHQRSSDPSSEISQECESAMFSQNCSTKPSEEQTNDMFLSQFSDEEVRKMDTPFQTLDMFPDSMHRLLSYENMLSGVLTGSQHEEANLDQDEMDTCGFPLFSHDLQDDDMMDVEVDDTSPSCAKLNPTNPEMLAADTSSIDKGGGSITEMSTPAAADTPNTQEEVLEELEDIVFQLAKKTRICVRDAFYRLAESSRAQCSAAAASEAGPAGRSSDQTDGGESRYKPQLVAAATRMQAERETNAIDRTVVNLAFRPPCSSASAPQQGDGPGAEVIQPMPA